MSQRRSQGRRSSNLMPIRPLLFSKVNSNISLTASATKRSSSIPRPSTSNLMKSGNGRSQESLLYSGTTPSRTAFSFNRTSMATPNTQRATAATPQSLCRFGATNSASARSNSIYLKETRNLSDKNCLKEMMNNLAEFLTDSGYQEVVTLKEVQKIDMTNLMKYFNFLFQFVDRSYQLVGRFSEEEWIKNVKELGYCGTLKKSVLKSIGTLHGTAQLAGLLSWLADLIRKTTSVPQDDSIEAVELDIMMRAYDAWCRDQPLNHLEEYKLLYMEKHGIPDGDVTEFQRKIRAITDESRQLEKKTSDIEKLGCEAKRLEQWLEEQSVKETQLQQRLKELQQEDKYILKRFDETKEKTLRVQVQTDGLKEAAQRCKLSVVEARRIERLIAALRSDVGSSSEQRAQVARLVETREMQLANVAAQDIQASRSLNSEVLGMSMSKSGNVDWKECLFAYLEEKPKDLCQAEHHCLATVEKKGRISEETYHLKIELKHAELQKNRLDDDFRSLKAERDQVEQFHLSYLSELEKASAAQRSDPVQMRNDYEMEALSKKILEGKSQLAKKEKEIKLKMKKNSQEMKNAEAGLLGIQKQTTDFYSKLMLCYRQAIQQIEDGSLSVDVIEALLPTVDF